MRALPVSRRHVVLTTLLAVLGLTACEKSPQPTRASVTDASTGREVAGPAAFDVVALEKAAALIWAEPAGTLVAERFEGQNRRTQRLRTLGVVTEIAALRIGERVGVSWVELGKPARVRAALFDFTTSEPSVVELGSTDARRGVRGHFALASRDDGAFTVLHRAQESDCIEKPGRCT